MFTCKDVSRLLSEAMDRELSAPERATVGAHLPVCVACRNCGEQFRVLREAMIEIGFRHDRTASNDPRSG